MNYKKLSLFEAINSVNEAHFLGNRIAAADREAIAARIAERQGKPHAYADMFAPPPTAMKSGIRLFTGELVRPSASLRHVFGEEACRAMILLKPGDSTAKDALNRASSGMLSRLREIEPNRHGMFCCGTCDPALWRHLVVGGLKGEERWIANGLKALKEHHDAAGKWRRFHFFYTLLALTEIDLPAARREMKYAAPECEAFLKRARTSTPAGMRRKFVSERVLANC